MKKSLKTPLVKFINVVAKFVGKIVSVIKGVVVKVPFIGKWLAKKIPSVSKIGKIISGTTASVTINKLLDIIIPNITVFLSVGGFVSGLLDWAIDKKLDNKIWTF